MCARMVTAELNAVFFDHDGTLVIPSVLDRGGNPAAAASRELDRGCSIALVGSPMPVGEKMQDAGVPLSIGDHR